MTQLLKVFGLLWIGMACATVTAHAGVFNIAQFVEPGLFAIGIEPEVIVTNGAGVGATVKYTHGLNDLLNLQGLVGMGAGPRNFRVGANLIFDFFPDIDNQPGMGIAVQGLFVTMPGYLFQVEISGSPYIHKAFTVNGTELNPFLAVPMGMSFSGGRYQFQGTAALGAMFKPVESFRFTVEVGLGWLHTESYVSGGVTYYYR